MAPSAKEERDKVLSKMEERYRPADRDLGRQQDEAERNGDTDKVREIKETRNSMSDAHFRERGQVIREYQPKIEQEESVEDEMGK